MATSGGVFDLGKKNLVIIITTLLLAVGSSQGLSSFQNQNLYDSNTQISDRMLDVITAIERNQQQQTDVLRRIDLLETTIRTGNNDNNRRLSELETASAVLAQEEHTLRDYVETLDQEERIRSEKLSEQMRQLEYQIYDIEVAIEALRLQAEAQSTSPYSFSLPGPPGERGR